ncbi:zinc-binding dehydrogenase [Pseudacidovorax intermedius]|uniref:zinc-binding dehydrogenase n=1 Tax=Pseudacidovorax intermedius TaxID=433924 RepID=UPI0026F11460|nr:zinc-binding dehydrogenase [Pseudacidovorax intermedius]
MTVSVAPEALARDWPAAWFALHHRARLLPGESVLVLDACSPVGMACVQLAKAAQARVVALTRRRSEFGAARRCGADDIVSLEESQWVEIVREHGGADVIAGIADADLLARSMRALARHGRLLVMAPPEDLTAELPLEQLLRRSGTLHGAFWSADQVLRQAKPIMAALTTLLAQGAIQLECGRLDTEPFHPDRAELSRT